MVQVFPDLEKLSSAAAEIFADLARRSVEEKGRCTVLLSGGSTPQRTYQLLAREAMRDAVPWQGVEVFWGDERWVPPDDSRSNAAMARRLLLDHVPVSPSRIHPVPYLSTPHESAAAYEKELRAFFADGSPHFDLALLGLGENGHTASLFPGSNAVQERERWAMETYVAEQDLHRVTLTAPILNASGCAMFLVSGENKASILRETLEGPFDPQRIPAQLIRPTGGTLLWLVDREAARLLKG